MRNIAFETNRLKGRSTIHKNMVYWEESCVIFTPPLSSLFVSSLLFCQSFSSCHAWLVALLGVKTL